jgi:hypothetical protein
MELQLEGVKDWSSNVDLGGDKQLVTAHRQNQEVTRKRQKYCVDCIYNSSASDTI